MQVQSSRINCFCVCCNQLQFYCYCFTLQKRKLPLCNSTSTSIFYELIFNHSSFLSNSLKATLFFCGSGSLTLQRVTFILTTCSCYSTKSWPAMQWHAYKRFFCFSVRELDTALFPLAIHFECVQISVFCYIFVIVDRSKANTWKCLRDKHLTSNTPKTWRDLAMTSAAPGRLFDARLVRPPLQAHTKAVQLAKKGQVNNVLPSCTLNETSMLRLQTVARSALFPKKKSPRLEKLSKPPQGASKLASFDTVLAVRTLAVTFFFLRLTCSCRLSGSLSSFTWHLISWC